MTKETWYSKNKEISIQRAKQWALENPDRVKEIYRVKKDNLEFKTNRAKYQKEWRSKNLGRVAQYTAARRVLRLRGTPKCLTEWDMFYIEEFYDIASKRRLTVDHIIPLKHNKVCGLHTPSNLQFLTVSENCSKHNRFEI